MQITIIELELGAEVGWMFYTRSIFKPEVNVDIIYKH